jgi:hypothetical protein
MDDLIAGELRITTEPPTDGATIQLNWLGKSGDRHPRKILEPYFTDVLKNVSEQGLELELHFEKLQHLNSSTITALIQLIQDARHQNVKLTFVYDSNVRWQKLSFEALDVFARDGAVALRPV